jgi:hypothetical protein
MTHVLSGSCVACRETDPSVTVADPGTSAARVCSVHLEVDVPKPDTPPSRRNVRAAVSGSADPLVPAASDSANPLHPCVPDPCVPDPCVPDPGVPDPDRCVPGTEIRGAADRVGLTNSGVRAAPETCTTAPLAPTGLSAAGLLAQADRTLTASTTAPANRTTAPTFRTTAPVRTTAPALRRRPVVIARSTVPRRHAAVFSLHPAFRCTRLFVAPGFSLHPGGPASSGPV